ncbi:MAG: glycosyltransferase family 87 protein [Candidatus Nanopelagicales bacterium]
MEEPQQPSPPQSVAPTRDDPVIASNSEFLGGPVGNHAAAPTGFWNPLIVLAFLSVIAFTANLVTRIPCIGNGFNDPGRYTHLCYSDIPPLFSLRGFSANVFPYIHAPLPGTEQLEYPVLTGMFMQVANWLKLPGVSPGIGFYLSNALLLGLCLIVLVLATALTVRRRPWDAAMVALAPALILTATINWDLLAVALAAIGLAFWARKHPVTAGVFIGLAAAAKFYPFLLLGPLLILCFRAKRMRAFWQASAGVAAAWLVVNVPFMLINFDGWYHFYKFSSTRGEDFGSIWLFVNNMGAHVPDGALNTVATGLFLLLCAGIAVLGLRAKRRPRLASLCFLVVAAFLLTNKVYSPQYVLWLIPLAALARPRWRDFLIWQTGEVIYYVAIWLYLAGLNGGKGLPSGWYSLAIMIHVVATCYFAAMVIRDILRPEHDPVRTDGWQEDQDDPGGGVLDGAPDRWDPAATA